jgi:hypothetical protein
VRRPGRDEGGVPFAELNLHILAVERPVVFEHDVDLVVFVRLLSVRLGCDEDVEPLWRPGDSWTTS